MHPTPECAGLEQMRGDLVGIDVRLGQHDPENCSDHHHVSAGQRHVGKPGESAPRAGTTASRTRPATTCSITMSPPAPSSARTTPRRWPAGRSAPFRCRSRRMRQAKPAPHRRSRVIAVQPVQIQPCLKGPALPEQKGQRDQAARPERDRAEVHEFEEGRHRAGSLDLRLDHAIQSPTPR